MPIYAYRCSSCGHAQDVLQKMSDPVLAVCPACGTSSYAKQLTAAGFQLKGSGWYVTDFKGGNTAAPKTAEGGDAAATGDDKPADKPTEKADGKTADKVADKPADGSAAKVAGKPAAPAPATALAPAPAPAAPPAASGS